MRHFSKNFWVYLISGVFWSLGLMTFFLVYNLHLVEVGFHEAAIGKITSAFTLGSLTVTMLMARLLNRYGENRVIQSCVFVTVILLPLRTLPDALWWLLVAAFLNGASIAGWMVSAPPFLTRNAAPEGRTWAFSLSYGSSIGTGALAGLIVSFLFRDSTMLARLEEFAGFSSKQCVLLASSASVLIGFCGLLFLKATAAAPGKTQTARPFAGTWTLIRSRFILQLLGVLVLWSFFVGSFPPFFNVFFHKQFSQSLEGIGIIFSVSQLCQLAAVLCMPWLVVRLGRVRAISSVQFASALVLPVLIVTGSVQVAGLIYVTYLSMQVMAEPALESFMMDSVLPEERNTVASLRYMTLFSVQALAVLISGIAITQFGYSFLLGGITLIGIVAAIAFYFFFQSRNQLTAMTKESGVPATCPLH